MRELPLLACDSVAINLREGRQTQHRGLMRPQPVYRADLREWFWPGRYATKAAVFDPRSLASMAWLSRRAPWQLGDMLYVRECWAPWTSTDSEHCIVFRGDETARVMLAADDGEGEPVGLGRPCSPLHLPPHWRPSIHMPKWAARTWLKVKRVWAERAQDISEEDARAEGVARFDTGWRDYTPKRPGEPTGACFAEARDSFASLLESLYPGSWQRNDWLWCCQLELDRERSGATS